MAKAFLVLLMIALIIVPQAAWAGGCGVYSYAVPYVQTVYQPIYQPFAVYQVGSQLEIDAAVERRLRQREQYQFQQQQAGLYQYQNQQAYLQQHAQNKVGPYAQQHPGPGVAGQPAPQQGPPPLARDTASLATVSKHCAACHNGPNSMGGSKWDMTQALDPEVGMRVIDWVANPQSPKVPIPSAMTGVFEKIQAQEKGAFLNEWLSIPRSQRGGDLAQAAPAPPQQQTVPQFGGF